MRACRDIASLERSLADSMRARPFVLLGVNSDGDTIKLKEQIKDEHITARSWCDGGGNANTPGPISRQFNIHGWPSLYLLDDHGVIRRKFQGTPSSQKLRSAIESLVRAAEQGERPR